MRSCVRNGCERKVGFTHFYGLTAEFEQTEDFCLDYYWTNPFAPYTLGKLLLIAKIYILKKVWKFARFCK